MAKHLGVASFGLNQIVKFADALPRTD